MGVGSPLPFSSMSVVLGFGQRVIGVAVWGYCEGAVVQCFVRNDLFVKESMGGKESWRALLGRNVVEREILGVLGFDNLLSTRFSFFFLLVWM